MTASGEDGGRPALTVIVVSYRTKELTLAALDALYRETRSLDMEVIVVDNASDDGSADAIAERFPRATLIRSEENLGFAAANNLAAERARGELLLLLNPDTEVRDRAVERVVEFARARPEARIWGGRTVFADGRLNPGSCWGAPTPWSTLCAALGFASKFGAVRWLNPEGLGSWPRDSERAVDIVSGCFLLIERSLWEELGGFDPAFFMYGEDADLCLRARARGARPRICPEATLVHHGGASERVRADKMVRLFTAKARLFRRYWGRLAWVGVRELDLWALVRVAGFAVVSLVSGRAREGRAQWSRVWKRRAEWRARDATGTTPPGPA